MHVIDGKALAATIRADVKNEIAHSGLAPGLAVMLVGDDPASQLYVTLKQKAAEEVGIRVTGVRFPADASDAELIAQVRKWNEDPTIHAILVQLPLPSGHDEDAVIAAIAPEKDADGFHPHSHVIPPVHEGILRLVNETPLRLNGARAVILANSRVFARPLERLLMAGGMSVKTFLPDEIDRAALKEADLIVIAIGRPAFLTPDMVRDDVVIVDVGTNRLSDGKTVGDVDAHAFETTKVWLTPVPGGVGPMTVAQLLKNAVRLATPNPPPGGTTGALAV
jgi:methylenetetrahydrofolate dehydrogenase (NADP+)/methenyltetrahydrofolate cyclohydrolase